MPKKREEIQNGKKKEMWKESEVTEKLPFTSPRISSMTRATPKRLPR